MLRCLRSQLHNAAGAIWGALLGDAAPARVEVPPLQPGGGWMQTWRSLTSFVGPGALVCIAYVDPGNLEGDLFAGNSYGRSLLWMLVLASVRLRGSRCVSSDGRTPGFACLTRLKWAIHTFS